MAPRRRRRVLTLAWLVAVLAWTVGRALVVAATIGKYGVSPWAYGAIDLAVSGPYALATAGVVTNLLDGRLPAARRCGAAAAVAFVAPDAYLLLAGHRKPALVYDVVVTAAVVLAVAAAVAIRLEVRRGRLAG